MRQDRLHPAVWWFVPVAVLAALWPCLGAGLVYDDWVNFDRNPALRRHDWVALLTRPYYRPDTTFWRPIPSLAMGLCYLAGPFGVHALALVLHMLTAFVVGGIARLMWRDPLLAVFAALLFALHPLQVESVAWISALPGLFSGLFLLLAVRAILLWSIHHQGGRPWSAAVWLLGALLSKESGVVAVPVLIVLAFGAGGSRPRAARWLVALAAAGIGGAWFLLHAAMVGYRPIVLHQDTLCAGIAQMIVRQAALLCLPWPLTPFRPHPDSVAGDAGDVAAMLAVATAAGLAVWAWSRLRPHWRIASILTAAPLLLAAVTHQAVGPHPLTDRYLYVSVSGVALLVVAAVGRRALLLSMLTVLCGAISLRQVQVWSDDAAFAAHVVATSPTDPGVHVLAAEAAFRAGGVEGLRRARAEYGAAIALLDRPVGNYAKRLRAAALAGLSWCEFSDPDGDTATALDAGFRAALAEDDTYVPAWVGLGVACGLNGQYDEALAALAAALALDPLCPEAWFNLGQTQLELGQREAARASLAQALRSRPDLTAAKQLLAELR